MAKVKINFNKIKEAAEKAANAAKQAAQNAANATKNAAQNAASATQNAAQNAGSNIKGGLNNAGKKASDAARKAADAAKKAAQKAADLGKKVLKGGEKIASIALFIPLKPLALIFLKRNNIKPGNSNEEIITQVFNQINKKSFGFVGETDLFDFEVDQSERGTFTYGFSVTPEMIMVVVQFLSTIFAGIKQKKENNEELTKEEQDIYEQREEIEKKLADAAADAKEIVADAEEKADKIQENGAAQAIGILSGKGSGMNIALIVVVIIVIVIIFLRKK
jgi:hypothetical protein